MRPDIRSSLLRLVGAYNFVLGFVGSTFSVLWGFVGVAVGGFIILCLVGALHDAEDQGSQAWLIVFIAVAVLFFGGRFFHRVMRALLGFLPPGVRTNAAGDARLAKMKDVQGSGLWRRR